MQALILMLVWQMLYLWNQFPSTCLVVLVSGTPLLTVFPAPIGRLSVPASLEQLKSSYGPRILLRVLQPVLNGKYMKGNVLMSQGLMRLYFQPCLDPGDSELDIYVWKSLGATWYISQTKHWA